MGKSTISMAIFNSKLLVITNRTSFFQMGPTWDSKFMFMVTNGGMVHPQWLKQQAEVMNESHARTWKKKPFQDQTIDPKHNISQSFKGMGFIVIYPIPIKVVPHIYGCCFMFTHLAIDAIVINAKNPSNPCHFYIILLTLQHNTFYLPTYILMYIHCIYMIYIYIYYMYTHVNVHYFSSYNS